MTDQMSKKETALKSYHDWTPSTLSSADQISTAAVAASGEEVSAASESGDAVPKKPTRRRKTTTARSPTAAVFDLLRP
jgi:hypothetical protein